MRKIWIVFMVISLLGCSSANPNEEKKSEFEGVDQTIKNGYIDLGDGWYFWLSIQYENGELDNYSFDGINVKEKTLEGFSSTAMKNENGEVVYGSKAMPTLPEEELVALHTYLLQKKFDRTIEISDLDDYNGTMISKENLASVLNLAINSEEIEANDFGKYADINSANCVQMVSKQGETFQVSYFTLQGNIAVINIEYVDEFGFRLSDKVENNSASEEEIELQAKIDSFEQEVVKTQDFGLKFESNAPKDFDKKIMEIVMHTFSAQ